MCWEYCPAWATDTGLFCQDSVSIYGKGCCCFFGKCCNNCNAGYKDDGCTCRRDRTHIKGSYWNGAGSVMTCPLGMVKDTTGGPLGLCYKPCPAGYTGLGPVCWQNCGKLPGPTLPGYLANNATYGPNPGLTYCTRRSNGVITVSAAHLCTAWP